MPLLDAGAQEGEFCRKQSGLCFHGVIRSFRPCFPAINKLARLIAWRVVLNSPCIGTMRAVVQVPISKGRLALGTWQVGCRFWGTPLWLAHAYLSCAFPVPSPLYGIDK